MKLRNKKTGEVVDAYSIDAQSYETIKIQYFTKNGVLNHFSFNSLEELNDCLEDYKPAEPLIKDEKIRKAVRAWAALYDGSAIRAHIGEDYVALFKDEVNGYSSSVEIDLSPEVFNELIDTHYYTIAELCGEEEE